MDAQKTGALIAQARRDGAVEKPRVLEGERFLLLRLKVW